MVSLQNKHVQLTIDNCTGSQSQWYWLTAPLISLMFIKNLKYECFYNSEINQTADGIRPLYKSKIVSHNNDNVLITVKSIKLLHNYILSMKLH
jgi:hypothetical protein